MNLKRNEMMKKRKVSGICQVASSAKHTNYEHNVCKVTFTMKYLVELRRRRLRGKENYLCACMGRGPQNI